MYPNTIEVLVLLKLIIGLQWSSQRIFDNRFSYFHSQPEAISVYLSVFLLWSPKIEKTTTLIARLRWEKVETTLDVAKLAIER